MPALMIFVAIAILQVLLLLFLHGMALTVVDASLALTLLILIYRKLSELVARQQAGDLRRKLREERLLREAEEAKANETDESDWPSRKDMIESAREEDE
jgi:membrane protein implicated in regulation of membrane protease activity